MTTPNTALTIKQKKSIDKSTTIIEKRKALSRNTSIQSVSSDVFNDSTEMVDEDFVTPKKTTKRQLSAKSNDQESSNKKPMFVTTNRYALLTADDKSDPNTRSSQTPSTANCEDVPSKANSNYEDAPTRTNLPPPIIVRGVLDFIGFRDELVRLIGSDNFCFKSSTNDLKIQATKPDHYRVIIRFLKENEAQYHTYQPREEKSYRIVIRNLHPSTPTIDIGIAIEEKGYTVRQVTNVIHKTTKVKLPIFFIDLEPAEINKEIFNLTSLLHTRKKIEEPHKGKTLCNVSTVKSMVTPEHTVPIRQDAFAVGNTIHQPAA